MIVTSARPTYYEQLKVYVQKPEVKLAAAAATIFATSFVPLYLLPTCSKIGQIAYLAGASAGWGIFYTHHYRKPADSIVLAYNLQIAYLSGMMTTQSNQSLEGILL
jgi:hypothetical protein